VILHYPQEVDTSLIPGTFVFMICEDGEEHKGEMLLRRAKLEIRDSIRYFHGSPTKHLTVVVARKPLQGTVAENTLRYGCGGINIDACRVGTESITVNVFDDGMKPFGNGAGHAYTSKTVSGRWPANIVHDGDCGVLFPENAGSFSMNRGKPHEGDSAIFPGSFKTGPSYDTSRGSASRFFYTAPSLEELTTYLQRMT
jgi:site-specific DNA-methyltransferase (adenine-specific)